MSDVVKLQSDIDPDSISFYYERSNPRPFNNCFNRVGIFQRKSDRMRNDQSQLEVDEISLNMSVVNFIIIPTTFLVSLIIFSLIDFSGFAKENMLVFLISILAIIVFHEILHAIGFMIWGGISFESINFGYSFSSLAVYCHCSEPIELKIYRRILLLPLWVTGGITLAITFIHYMPLTVLLVLIAILSCFGDVMIFLKLRKFAPDQIVRDHPNKVGCMVYPVGQNLQQVSLDKDKSRTQNLAEQADTYLENSQQRVSFDEAFPFGAESNIGQHLKWVAQLPLIISVLVLALYAFVLDLLVTSSIHNDFLQFGFWYDIQTEFLARGSKFVVNLIFFHSLFDLLCFIWLPARIALFFTKKSWIPIVVSTSCFTLIHLGFQILATGPFTGFILIFMYMLRRKIGVKRYALVVSYAIYVIHNALVLIFGIYLI